MMVFFLNGTSLLRSISGPGSWGKIMTVKFSLPNAPRSIYFFFFNFSLTKRPVSRHFSASNRNRRENGPYLTGGAWKSSQPDTRAVVFGRLVAPARDEVTSLAWRDLRPGKRRVFYCLFVFFSWRSRKRTDLFVECFFFCFSHTDRCSLWTLEDEEDPWFSDCSSRPCGSSGSRSLKVRSGDKTTIRPGTLPCNWAILVA